VVDCRNGKILEEFSEAVQPGRGILHIQYVTRFVLALSLLFYYANLDDLWWLSIVEALCMSLEKELRKTNVYAVSLRVQEER
jgi:hypothetical protein